MSKQLDIVIQRKIHELRGVKIILDFDIAELYDVPTKVLKQSIRRNKDRFPEDFMFELKENGMAKLEVTNCDLKLRGKRYRPVAFTEYGVAMLSGLLRSEIAVRMNIEIVRTFIFLRKLAREHGDLRDKILEMEQRYDRKFNGIEQALDFLIQEKSKNEDLKTRKRIGFKNAKN
ncbi:MAG: ORF6N domain-containing protein [Bacteroidetes bacterium]|nr:ORF6N domain-containing protein [Bacteroidota bacterium]